MTEGEAGEATKLRDTLRDFAFEGVEGPASLRELISDYAGEDAATYVLLKSRKRLPSQSATIETPGAASQLPTVEAHEKPATTKKPDD